MPGTVWHLVEPHEWPAAGNYRPDSLRAEGFVHFSFGDQVATSANRHFSDAAQLMAVEFDPASFGDKLVVEDSYGSGTGYPHVYAAIPVSTAVSKQPLQRDRLGAWVFTRPGDAPARALPDR